MANSDIMRNHCADVLLELCDEIDLDNVSVTMLTKAAGISRPTFYKHFIDMNDLIAYTGVRPLLVGKDSVLSYDRCYRALELCKLHLGFFSRLARRTHGQNNFKDSYIAWMTKNLWDLYDAAGLNQEEKTVRRIETELYCAGFISVIFSWLSNGAQVPTELVAKAIIESRPDFLRAFDDSAPTTFPGSP